MAAVTAEYRYADGEVVTVMVDIENDYPDALADVCCGRTYFSSP